VTTIAGNISGTAGLTKSGSGFLVLAGSNPLSGTITLNNGTITVQNPSALTNVARVNLTANNTVRNLCKSPETWFLN
jgi:autotransporter-associated beta strand protein